LSASLPLVKKGKTYNKNPRHLSAAGIHTYSFAGARILPRAGLINQARHRFYLLIKISLCPGGFAGK